MADDLQEFGCPLGNDLLNYPESKWKLMSFTEKHNKTQKTQKNTENTENHIKTQKNTEKHRKTQINT